MTLTIITIITAIIGAVITWYLITPYTFKEDDTIITDEDERQMEVERIDFTKFKWYNKE